MIADQQQRLFGGEGGEERGLEGVVADNAERAEEGAVGGGRRDCWRRGVAGDGGESRIASHSRYGDCHEDNSAQELRRARRHTGRRDVSGPLYWTSLASRHKLAESNRDVERDCGTATARNEKARQAKSLPGRCAGRGAV